VIVDSGKMREKELKSEYSSYMLSEANIWFIYGFGKNRGVYIAKYFFGLKTAQITQEKLKSECL
jgi:hypothetical protein